MSTVITNATPAGGTPVRDRGLPRQAATCRAAVHGTFSAYRRGCRCPAAREQWRLYHKQRREGRARPRVVDATGTRRRLRALAALGWPMVILAAQLGYREAQAVSRLCQPGTTRVNVATAAAVRRLYDQLSMTPGPSPRARATAARSGWLPPLAWDDADLDNPAAAPDLAITVAVLHGRRHGSDHAAIERACSGQLPAAERLNPAERLEVVRRLRRQGLPDVEIAARARTTIRTVQRIRARLRPAHSGHRGTWEVSRGERP